MGTRGRKSTASLGIVTSIEDARPAAPDELGPDQQAVWRGVVERLPGSWFPRETHQVLAAYCRHVVSHRYLSKLIEACERKPIETDSDLKDYDKVLSMRDRETKAMIAAARSLRITKSSQMRAEAAGRASARAVTGPRPWERVS